MTQVSFDEKQWGILIQKKDWYLQYLKLAEKAKKQLGEETPEINRLNKQIRHFFEEQLKKGNVSVATKGPDLDAERQKIDTVVIHHTSHKPGYRKTYLNAVHLLNIYAPAYARDQAGQPIWSGHFADNQQVFWGYHWLMRMDGSFERLLDDNQIGWHGGNWDINKRSIGICLDNDYEKQDPTNQIIQKLANHIKKYYPDVKIIGHCEARQRTICPGTNFLDVWKHNLLSYLS